MHAIDLEPFFFSLSSKGLLSYKERYTELITPYPRSQSQYNVMHSEIALCIQPSHLPPGE